MTLQLQRLGCMQIFSVIALFVYQHQYYLKRDIIISKDIPQMHGMLALIILESIIKGSEYFASFIERATIKF